MMMIPRRSVLCYFLFCVFVAAQEEKHHQVRRAQEGTIALDTMTSANTLETCSVERHSCQCECRNDDDDNNSNTAASKGQVAIKILTWELMCLRLQQHTSAFERHTGIAVEIDCVTEPAFTRDQFHAEILSEAKTQLAVNDGYTLGPHMFGDLDLLEGLYDLTPLVRDKQEGIGNMPPGLYDLNWNDIFLFARENGAVYDTKIVGMPIDGDVHSLYYRKDLFAKYNKTPPATWEEYTALAKFFHGKYEPLPGQNSTTAQQISGSCVGKLERTEFWVSLILCSMTQYAGTQTGAFFDPRYGKNMEPLLGEAFVKTLQYMEEQFAYGADNEFEGTFKDVNLDKMNQGKCAMTYNWGDAFTEAAKAPPTSLIAGYLGTAPTPGSRYYLDRDTQRLKPCTQKICSCANNASSGECINSAPYAAYTGWAGGCSNFSTPDRKRACAEFFGYISSAQTSIDDTIPNITTEAPFIIVDPYRNSQTQLQEWVKRGLPADSTREYLETIKMQLSDTNVVLDMRIPRSPDFQSSMNAVFRSHLAKLQERKLQGMTGEALLCTDAERWAAERDIRARWREIIDEYDRRHSPPTLLEAYQRNLGVYSLENATTSTESTSLYTGLVIGLVVVVVAAIAIVLVFRSNRRKNDDIWKIKKSEVQFNGLVVGRGRFGVVLLAEFRGTEVAVKRCHPEKGLEASIEMDGYNTSCRAQMDKWLKNETGDFSAFEDNPPGPISVFKGDEESPTNTEKHDTRRFKPPEVVRRRQLDRDFKEQMRQLMRLRHPCIFTPIGAVVSPGEEPMLVMEFMQHGSLYDILHNETMVLEGPMLLNMLSDITMAVRFLHACDPPVIHCDIKASNILVDSRFRAKVADFVPGRATEAIGTPFWMAPEILLDGEKCTNTAASDVYAFGILLFEMFSGQDPYDGEDPAEVLKLVCDKAVNKRPSMPKNCPPQIDSLMRDCVVANPAERPTFEELDKRVKRVDEKDVLWFGTPVQETALAPHKSTAMALLDMFPRHIAETLREGGKVEPEQHEMVSIYFSDVVGFSDLSDSLEPRMVADLLSRLHDKLDTLTRKHDVFKVETVGDAYMAVANLVKDQQSDHVKRIVEFAADAIAVAMDTYIDVDDPARGVINLRVGIHSGPAVADVVGSINPRYCLFGLTVSTSSRMESLSEPNRIHCSEESAKLLQTQKPGAVVTPRGPINVKGMGSMLTFWVNHDNDRPSD